MPRKYSILALLISVALWMANSAQPPTQKTGAPGEGLCTDCHSLNGGNQDGSITLAGFPATIQPNQAYVLTITNSNPNGVGVKAGFEMTILNGNNQQAGTMSAPSATSNLQNANGRQYWNHFPAQLYPASNMVSWTVTWTAPNMPPNTTITYYAAGNIANGNNNSTGDLIVTSSGSGMLNGGADPLSVSITNQVNVLCFGDATGSATATAMGGTPAYSYVWSNGGSGPTISNLIAGTYTVTVTDNGLSTATTNVTITQSPNIVFNPPSIASVTCNGGNNGSITASATGGTPPFLYNWSNGGSGGTISNLMAGSYTVTTTDDSGCTKTATYNVTQPPPIMISLISLINETCAGAQDGGIIISTSGGTAPLFSEWSNGSIGNNIADLPPGQYTVTVTDNNNCTNTASYMVNPGGTVAVDLIDQVNVTCPGGSNGSITVLASGGMAPYTYTWSNGASGPMASNLAAGNYLVTATDANGCETVKFYTILQPPPFNLMIGQSGANLCFGDSNVVLTATITGGTPPYTASWSNGVTGLTNPNLGAGVYTVTITDGAGCTPTSSAVVTQPTQLSINVTTTDETGVGANDGTATAMVTGGTAAYTYLWSNGGTTDTITGLPPGMYTVTVTDANGCTKQATGQVDAFGCTLDVMLGADFAICAGDTTTLTPQVMGASGNVTYTWSNGSTTPTISVSTGGEYCVTVMDVAGCQDADCIILNVITIPAFNCQVMNESAPGLNDGAINCDSISGVVSYLWSNGATTTSISGLTPGQYCLTVTDLNGCTASNCYNVQPGNCNLSVTAIISDLVCAGDMSGSIAVTVENATPPVTYAWSNGGSTSTIQNLATGTYTVTVSDAAGCVDNKNYTVSEPAPIQINVDTVINISQSGQGLILISVSGGTAPYTYLWTSPSGSNSTTEDLFNLTEPGNYSVMVADAHGCTVVMDSIQVLMDVAVRPGPQFTSLKVYPVPARDELHIELDDQVTEVIVTGIDGRTVLHTHALQSNVLDVSGMDSGWYLLRISDGHQWYIARMVK